MPDSLVGRTLDGRYEVLERLGAGGVGVVYRGKQVPLSRFVAIKVMQQHAAASPEWRRRFDREAKALSALAHPNVVPVTDSGIDGGVPYLVMELLQGRTLADLIKEGPLPPVRALEILRQTLRGLAFAHGKGIVHRDLKPANVFLQALPDHADHVRLLDFGMAKFLEGSGSRSIDALTRVGSVFGTPSYMSPEQAKAEPVDARADVYAAGVVLFQILAGRLPFVGDTSEQIMKGHVFDAVPSLASIRPDLAIATLAQPIIERAMAKKPAARFADAASMLSALEAIVAAARASAASDDLAVAPTEPAPTARPARGARPRSWRIAVALVALGGASAAAVTVLRRHVDVRSPIHSATLPAARPPQAKSPAPPEPPRASAASPPQTAPLPPTERAEASRPRTRNPWRAAVPRALKPIRDKLEHGAHLSQRALRPAYEFAHENPGDPRPWLLLARAYAELDWWSDATDRYLRAYHVDATCRGDPQMLSDLLKAAEHPVAGRGASKAIRDIYGAEAIPAVDKALKRRAADREAAARLARLRDSLSS
jgi:serine/threonine-protein kinase